MRGKDLHRRSKGWHLKTTQIHTTRRESSKFLRKISLLRLYRPQVFESCLEMLGSHAHVASALLLLTMAIALNEAREDYVLLGMYAVGLLHGALLFALSRGGESRRVCTPQPKAAATPTPAPPAKSPVSVRPAAQLTMTVDKFESLRAGRKEPTAVLTPTSSRRKSLRTPNKVPRLGEWSE